VQGVGECFTACFRSPQYYRRALERLGARVGPRDAAVVIGGVNSNCPMSVASHLPLVLFVL
jgi:hypothetical protein